MKITDTILKALNKAIQSAGNKAQLAQKTGISNSLIGKYEKQEIEDMSIENWYKLYPFVSPHLPLLHGLPTPNSAQLNSENKTLELASFAKDKIFDIILMICKQDKVPDDIKIQMIIKTVEETKKPYTNKETK